ncbi:MAG: glycosyltransferase family 39 protein [Chakrabartia sp.]
MIKSLKPLLPLGLGLSLFLLLVTLSWVGFLGSDDVTYARGAYGWIEDFPFVGGHGTIRYTITIPMALSFLTFGENEVAFVLPSLLYMLGFLVAAYTLTALYCDKRHAFGALLALVTCPLLVVNSTIAGVDVIELCFLFLSVALYYGCLINGPSLKRLFAAGVCAGLGFLTRETSIFIAVFYGLLFLAGHGFKRRYYWMIAAGFLAVWGLELLYLGVMTGDPLYRYSISMHHDATIDRSIDLAGNVIVHPVIDPFLVLLLNQELMLLFFVAIPLGIWLCFGRGIDPKIRHFSRIFALFGVTWFVCAGAAYKLLPLNPRYFMATTAVACILTGIGLVSLWTRFGWPRVAAGIAALLLGSNAVGMYVENKDFMFAERSLVQLSRAYPKATIVTDPMTRYRADLLLRWDKAQARVTDMGPQSGALFFYNVQNVESPNRFMTAKDSARFKPQLGWSKLTTLEPQPTYAARFLEVTGVAPMLPPAVWKKLRYHHQPVTLYQVPARP